MWSGFVVTLPWQVYLNYGDKGVLETNYPMIRNWLAFADTKTRDHILEPYVSIGMRMPEWNYLGDWVIVTIKSAFNKELGEGMRGNGGR